MSISQKYLCNVSLFTVLCLLAACEEPKTYDNAPEAKTPVAVETQTPPAAPSETQTKQTQLLWGDTHIHTMYSLDAFAFGNRFSGPDVAFRWAKGDSVSHPITGQDIRIGTPLDFLVVADHAEYAGTISGIFSGEADIIRTETGRRLHDLALAGENRQIGYELVDTIVNMSPFPDLIAEPVRRTAWDRSIEAADAYNDPGEFTAFIGWEWSSLPDAANLHRVVFTSADSSIARQFLPFSAFESERPEELWAWLDQTSARTGAEFVAIPHNSNISKGAMFALADSSGEPIDARYAETRMRWEPVAEMTQVKGDSETHPTLSPDDPFANFERYEHVLDTRQGADTFVTATTGDYLRSALRRGLEIGSRIGRNPYRLGMIGSTDMHTSISSAEEDNFWGKYVQDSIAAEKHKEVTPGANGWYFSAAGLAAVWSTENTREAILEAFRRREVYATTGPRIAVRFFGAWSFDDGDAERRPTEIGYAAGVPMGGVLPRQTSPAPKFIVSARKDPKGANLDRIQIVKGWLTPSDESQEIVYDVAWSDGRERDQNERLPPVGNTVDLTIASYKNTIGSPTLFAIWQDPDFNAAKSAFYYVRVLAIPTPRHSLYDTVALGIDPEAASRPAFIQERAYTSPIWHQPQ